MVNNIGRIDADPLTGRVEGEPRELVGVYLEHEYDCAKLRGVGLAEELARHPQLVKGPADVGRAEPKPVGGDLSHLDEMPDRRRTLHLTIVAAIGMASRLVV